MVVSKARHFVSDVQNFKSNIKERKWKENAGILRAIQKLKKNQLSLSHESNKTMYQAANTYMYAQLHHLHLPFQLPDVRQLVLASSSSQPTLSGTSFLKKSDLPHHYRFSDVDWKLIFSIAFNSCKVIEVFFLENCNVM